MRVGMVGLGKLGLPVAYAMAARGLDVFGHDPNVTGPPEDTSHEEGLAEAIREAGSRMHFCSLQDVVVNTDVLFLAVQTPHEARFEGITPLPEDRADFDYSYLIQAVKNIVRAAGDKPITLSVISTVLPGTMKRYIEPLLSENVSLVYSPSFIAMGTTIADFLYPEFVLLGGDDERKVGTVFYEAGVVARWYRTSIPNAELIKVSYNTFIGLKIAFANTLMEVCHKTDCDVDEVTGALKLAHRRLISPAYLDGGMGDGGQCHPRDNIALSWLARELDLSHDLFEDAMVCRENQARWLVSEWAIEYLNSNVGGKRVPMALLGLAYKPGSSIVTGSAAALCMVLLQDEWHLTCDVYDPHVLGMDVPLEGPRTWLVGCKHPEFVDLKLPAGSVVIDPFRYMPDQEGVEVIRLGSSSPSDSSSESLKPSPPQEKQSIHAQPTAVGS